MKDGHTFHKDSPVIHRSWNQLGGYYSSSDESSSFRFFLTTSKSPSLSTVGGFAMSYDKVIQIKILYLVVDIEL
jgi:hypothetical protein